MPFTLSHPAAAGPFWPLIRRGLLPLSALAIGTMTPDFEFIRGLRSAWGEGHTAPGLFFFCLPVGLVTLLLWVALLRDPVRDLLTLPNEPLRTGARWWVLAVPAVLVGAATHQLWDGVTHGAVWAQRVVPHLDRPVVLGIPLFNLLQHLSTLVGGVIVLAWLWRQIRETGNPPFLLDRWRVATVAGILVVSACIAVWNGPSSVAWGDFWLAQGQLGDIAVGALLGLLIGLGGFSLVHRIALARQAQQAR